MSKPIPGQQYIITDDDTSLESIATRAYGDPKEWTRIFKANQNTFTTANPEDIITGQIIIIPVIPENEKFKTANRQLLLPNKESDELTILANNIEIKVESARIFKAMDNAAHGWSFVIAWEPGIDKNIDNIVLPYSYTKSAVYIGGELQVNGLIYNPQPSLSNRSEMTLEAWSFTADLIDSNLKPPYERSKITLKQLAEELVKPFGINVIYDIDDDEFFDRVTAGATETIFQHLVKYASQRGVLITATSSGDLLFTRSNPGQSVGTIKEGDTLSQRWFSEFDGRKRFNVYKAIGQSPLNSSKTAIAEDNKVPRSRFKTFSVNDTTDGNIQKAADWRRSKALADSLTIEIPVTGWLAPNGSLWKNNTLITIISPTLFVPNGHTFIIRAVEYILNSTGRTAILSIVPPEVYTGENIIDPWEI